MRFEKWPQLPGAGRTRAGHHHGSHTPISPEAILLGKMDHHTKQIRRECKQTKSAKNDFKHYLRCCILCPCKCPHITHFKTQCHRSPLVRLTELSLTRDYCKTSSKDTEKKEIHKESNFRAMLIRIEMASKKYCGMSVAVLYYYVLLLCSWYC